MSDWPPGHPLHIPDRLPDDPALDLADTLALNLAQLKEGSLSFWGQWFGKPHDNSHRVVGAAPLHDMIVIYFDHGETLTVASPRDWSIDNGALIIRDATRVHFQWFDFSKPPSRETLLGREHIKRAGDLWQVKDVIETKLPDTRLPAVQLHG